MKLVSIVGARPQFVKVWPIAACIERLNGQGADLEHVILHTGQHYSPAMSAALFEELGIPAPAVNLNVGSGSHGEQTGRMLIALERALDEAAPDVVVLYGDTNSTVAGALAAAQRHLPVAHVEAGLRSGDRRMPEEVNRIVADHLSDLLLAPTPAALANLQAEGLGARAMLAGDVMYDAWVASQPPRRSRVERTLARYDLEPECFALVTLHRADVGDGLAAIVGALNRLPADGLPVLFPAHPRTAQMLASSGAPALASGVRVIDPVGYLEMGALLETARIVLTDSGGVQKEAFFAGCPCVTLRSATEWVETVQDGANVLVGHDPDQILAATRARVRMAPSRTRLAARAAELYGGGQASRLSIGAIVGLGAGAAAAPAQATHTNPG